MKNLLLLLLLCFSLSFSQLKKETENFIPSFELKPNDLELSRLAQPTQYFDKIGPRAGLMGYESGQFEMWVWPWKPLRNFELQFILGTSTQPILAKDIVRTISVTPEVTTLIYTYESFTVKQHFFIPRDEPGAIILLDVYTTTPLSIIPGFIPVMQPMWPAGIGGQFSYWDDEVKGYVISEAQWRAIVLCGSPAGQQMAAPPAHMFGDNPLQFRIDVKPKETEGKFIPIIITGAMPDTVNWKMKYDSVKATYNRLWKNAENYYRECYDYYQNLRTSTMQITTPDKEINLAYEWGKVALDNLMIKNPRLGYGMVAGFGLSGGGARPGFAWYFGGDAFINILTMNSVGMFQQARDALAFTQKWQRQDNFPIRKKNPNDPPVDVGKMAHELSQSDGLCDWWNDYRYGYNHADTSPWYLVAIADYVRTSGDVEFLRHSWKSVKQAYEWCLSKDSDGDGLMDLKGAGLGALEFGKLVGIYADVYTCGVFVQGIKEMKYMAELMGDSLVATQADAQYKKAQPRLEKLFWLEKEGYYAYGATEKGEQVKEKTPWSGVAMMFGLLDEERSAKSIEAFNSADLCTDWGVRTLSNKSELFEPTNYNYGAVWPFIGMFFNTAQFKHHYALSGYQILQANIKHTFDNALGVVPEVFSGELNTKLGEAYHHQGFSTTGYMLPLVRGLLGLDVDGVNKIVRLTPHVPTFAGPVLSITNIRIGYDTLILSLLNQSWLGPKAGVSIGVSKKGTDSVSVEFYPSLDFGSEITRVSIPSPRFNSDTSRTSIPFDVMIFGQDKHAITKFKVLDDAQVLINYKPIGYIGIVGYKLLRMDSRVSYRINHGSINSELRIISEKFDGKRLVLTVEGLSGVTYDIDLWSFLEVEIEGTKYAGDWHKITFDKKPKQEFVRKEIVITLK
ncbi:MAG: GH116 family glycosyl hydrolase [Bacteroidota bacterium]|nr:GH116 family glycosyl hydrolase [Bacteroidota bacterium]